MVFKYVGRRFGPLNNCTAEQLHRRATAPQSTQNTQKRQRRGQLQPQTDGNYNYNDNYN